ncbi:MAG: RNA 2',3'-cyclic phosphodiesterase [Nitrospirota bacterium]|nr:RNA 2',3'-cyclic phosphodiesterase [Nitrospirota bacterium]
MIRVFLAVELSSGIRENLFSLQQELKKILPPINWVRPESIHLTLKFLGYVEPSCISQLLLALEPIGIKQHGFSIEVQGVGVFPQVKHPRILWVGVTGKTHALQELVLEIESTLEPLGFSPEEKPYHPHLTLARIKRDNAIVGSALLKHGVLEREPHLGTLTVDRLTLFQSDLDSTGATYTPLGTVLLSTHNPEL